MAWFKVDDGFATSPKVLSIPRAHRLAAIGLWTVAGTWCSKHLTDGRVPGFMLEEWGADVSHGTALVAAGLWVETEAGYAFHAWDEYQPSRADVQAHRDRERRRKEEWRAKKAGNTGESHADVPTGQQGVSHRPSALPDPTHPDPTRPDQLKGVNAAKRGARIPDQFIVTTSMRLWAAEKVPLVDVDVSTAKFVDFWRAKTGKDATKLDWVATWRNWLRSDQERAERFHTKPTPTNRAMQTLALGLDDGPRAVSA